MAPTVQTQIDADLAELIGDLKNRRQQYQLTLKDIEARTGISFVTISKLENLKTFNPHWFTLVAYADALGLDVRTVLTRKRR